MESYICNIHLLNDGNALLGYTSPHSRCFLSIPPDVNMDKPIIRYGYRLPKINLDHSCIKIWFVNVIQKLMETKKFMLLTEYLCYSL